MDGIALSRRGLLSGAAVSLAAVAGAFPSSWLGVGEALAKGRDDGAESDDAPDHDLNDDRGRHRNRNRGRHRDRHGRRSRSG